MTFIKICGVTRLVDARAALQAGADLLGFNFYEPSPRSISPAACALMTSVLREEFPQAVLVGVFVNMPLQQIRAIMQACSLDLAQLHGDESPGALAALNGKAFKAFRGVPQPEAYRDFILPRHGMAPALLVDAAVQGLYGGSGQPADWQAAASLAQQIPILLAGGLKPENVAEAIRQAQPWGVDSASGVEDNPREKDARKIEAFVRAVRAG
jgi:phosphoribosylanthranilate isomerase